MIDKIQELNFPDYATLSSAEIKFADMGEKTITSQVKIDGDIAADFTHEWAVAYKGEKYIMPLRKPQGVKDNTSLDSKVDLTFQHWAIYQLKSKPFVTLEYVDAGVAVADKYQASVSLTLSDFCVLLSNVLRYHYGEQISVDYNSAYADTDAVSVNIDKSYIWDIVIKMHELYGVRWEIAPKDGNGHADGEERYVIRIGYDAPEIGHIFEHGFEGGLMKIERQVQSEDIRNVLVGRGGTQNLPRYYFKQVPEAEQDKFHQDPDWIPELANIYFDRLRGATFRSYVQGWKHARYGGENKRATTYAQWAYDKGYTDTKFDPVEFVKDDASISEYGELFGFAEDNDEVYPSITYSNKNVAVAVEQVTSDDAEASTESDAQIVKVGAAKATALKIASGETKTITIYDPTMTLLVPEGMVGNFIDDTQILRIVDADTEELLATTNSSANVSEYATCVVSSVKVISQTGITLSASGLSAGLYTYRISVSIENLTDDKTLNVEVGTITPRLQYATPQPKWGSTFDVWVDNLFDSTFDEFNEGETEAEYAERVWRPILGDREGNEAKMQFITGALAVSEDYEFVITAIPTYDTSKEFEDKDGNVWTSHWRLTLGKSDADLETLGVYTPNTQRQGAAGDKFVFLGVEVPQQYVEWAERAVDDAKTDVLNEKKDVRPTWAVSMDRVRLSNEGKASALIDELKIGASVRIADKNFITTKNENGEVVPSSAETLYLQELTIKYREATNEDAALNPDVDVVLSNDYSTSANALGVLQGEVDSLSKHIGALSNIEKAVRVVGDKLYLRKDGISDRSYSPTEFASLLTSADFRNGIVGGKGWGFFKDANGNWALEVDNLNVRQEFQVTTLVINQAEARGGMEISTAARIECTAVSTNADSSYTCYFDQKGGSVMNLFKVGDVAYSQRWTADNGELKYYKRRVIEVGANYITLAGRNSNPIVGGASWVNGSGVPEVGDVIIHFGSYTDARRQYVKVRDVINGGYERFLDGLNSVTASGEEYYFVGIQNGSYGDKPRFFIGNDDNFIEFLNDTLTIKANISIESTFDGQTIPEYLNVSITDNVGYLKEALKGSTSISGGLILASAVEVRDADGATTAGMNGIADSEHANGGVVFWGGGTYDDAYNGNSTYVIYADGTGHAANGTIKFEENKLQVGEYVNLNADGLDMTINGARKMQMGDYDIQPSIIMNSKLFATFATPISIDGMNGYRFPDSSAPYYGVWVEGLRGSTNPVTATCNFGAAVKGATLTLSTNALIPIMVAMPVGIFPSVQTNSVPKAKVELYSGNTLVHNFGTQTARIGYTFTNADGTTGTSDPENLYIDFRGKSWVCDKDYSALVLKISIWNGMGEPGDEYKDQYVALEGISVGGNDLTLEQSIPEYNQTTLGANGLQVSWGNSHQYQSANFWGARVGKHGIQVTDGDVRVLMPETNYEWWSLERYIKYVIATQTTEATEE